ncbi:MAG: S1C family serine protease [Bacteriovorax sp.]
MRTLILSFLIHLCIIYNPSTYANDFSKHYQKYDNAVVKIFVRQHNLDVSFGSGFFVDSNGYLITNYHVISSAMTPGFSASILLKSGVKLEDFEVISCDVLGLDLCLLKVNYKPEAWISAENISSAKEGSPVAVIGHPKGLNWSISDGVISGFRENQTLKKLKFQLVQLSAPISPGNSGGPVIDSQGLLVGVTTSGMFSTTSQNLNFAVSAKSANDFYKENKNNSPRTFKQFKQDKVDLMKALSHGFYKDHLEADLKLLDKNLKPLGPVKTTKIDGLNHSYEFSVPELPGLLKCGFIKDSYYCEMFNGDHLIVSIAPPTSDFMKQANQKIAPTPLKTTVELFNAGVLKSKNAIPKEELKYFFSIPDPIKCIHLNTLSHGTYNRCSEFIYNYEIANSAATVKKIQLKEDEPIFQILSFSMDANSSIIIFGLADYIEMSLKRLN